MKRILPIIVVMITLSLLGLMYLQLSWLKNALLVQKNKYNNEIENSVIGIRKGILGKATSVIGYNPSSANYYDEESVELFWSSVRFLSNEEINRVIEKELNNNHINLPFQYCIVHKDLNNIIKRSNGFTPNLRESSYLFDLSRNGTLQIYLFIDEPKNYILKRTSWMIAVAIIFTVVIVVAFTITLRTLFKLKKIDEIKTDFINNMTHEFKTPLATISLAVDALKNKKVIQSMDLMEYYSGIIKEENKRMNKQVEKILEAAQLEKNEIELQLQPLNVHDVIENVVNNAHIQINEKQGRVIKKLKAKNVMIMADEVHFTNIIFNLFDNAIKYSKAHPIVVFETNNVQDKIEIKITDNGIGMNKETVANIFEKFYRAHTGNVHNVKGFGLGLSYVKAIVERHLGKIKVESSLGKGSMFRLQFPNAKS